MVVWLATAMAGSGVLGAWEFSGGASEIAARDAVVEEGAQRFNFAIRMIARSKIAKACALDKTVLMEEDAGTLTLTFTGDNPRVSTGPADGTPFSLRGSNITFDLKDTKLVVHGSTNDGSKHTVYQLQGDSLKATHSIRAKTLGDAPLTWTVTYRRK